MGLLIFLFLLVISVCIQSISVFYYFTGFLNLKIKKKTYLLIVTLLIILIKFLPENISMSWRILFIIVTLIITVNFSFYGGLSKKLYHTIFFVFIFTQVELGLSLTTHIHGNSFKTNLIYPLLIYFGLNFISLIIVILITKLLLYFKVDYEIGLSNIEYMLLTIVPTLSTVITIWISSFNRTDQKIAFLFFLLIINFCNMKIYDNLIRKNYLIQKYMLIDEQNKFYREYLDKQKELIRLNHDLNNILVNLHTLILCNELDEAKKQLNELIAINGSSSYNKFTGCISIDSILSSKLDKIKRNDIHYELSLQIPIEIDSNHNSIDLAAVLGNLLDNAIEAVLRIPDQIEKVIDINLKYLEGKLLIKIRNTSKSFEVNFSNAILKSEKKVNRYGVGISSIKERVSKMNGYYDFSYKEGFFQALVIIPM
ncbi:GHKL domain-containing protein [Gottfriedia sp. NPDC057991]|uniref:GHKL domain-containing protein n=1 Tax=Gottfriedia sp. NPDC057991 TaxID=3346298 RepID=UPI0036DED110